ncbi:Mesoderm induction early response protein 1 isoform 1 [Dorcoceras hygrometricum]|uniref:Mesoderm induction early response protein 1 isoform 1 n=1 Tax=Dorcoceras hygrometricum TaxID=472368 RepID=A0A2Z7A6K0_9LAMI|nr:Mesoderm induction early response protein 1 isoform 1 [Dorcoceras hygrometricum]
MADDKEEEAMPKGNEWEVLTLTDSEYAAAPGPTQSPLDDSQSNLVGDDTAETSNPMIMSGHFVFPRRQNENLQEKSEDSGKGDFGDATEQMVNEEGKPESKHEEDLIDKGLIPDEFPRTPNMDAKGDEIFFNFADDASSNLLGKDQSMQTAVKFDLHDSKSSSFMNEECSGITEPSESLGDAEKARLSNVQQHGQEVEDNSEPSNLPSAAVMGLVILGHRWQRDRQQALLPKSQLVIDDEGTGWILGPVSRLKAVTTLGGQPGSYIRVSIFDNT